MGIKLSLDILKKMVADSIGFKIDYYICEINFLNSTLDFTVPFEGKTRKYPYTEKDLKDLLKKGLDKQVKKTDIIDSATIKHGNIKEIIDGNEKIVKRSVIEIKYKNESGKFRKLIEL